MDQQNDSTEKPQSDGLTPDQLLSAISDLLISTRNYQSRSDRAYANELAGRIIQALPEESKIRAAEIIAKLADPPEPLLRQLAFSSIEAARIVLSARHVTDAVLMEAVSKSQEHREIIARRPSLSEPVVNRLLFHEETSVENAILARGEIPLSNSRVKRLISRVEPGTTLGSMLARRTDLTPRLALRLFWRVEGESRKAILQRFNVDPGFAAQIFVKVLRSDEETPKPTPLSSLAALVARAHKASEADEGALSRPEDVGLLTAFRTHLKVENAQKVADRVKISFALAKQIMEDAPGDSFAVLASAMGVHEKVFKAKLAGIKPSKRSGVRPFQPADKDRLCAIYENLKPASAIAILSYWDIDLRDQEEEAAKRRLEKDIADIKNRLSDAFPEKEAGSEEPAAKGEPKRRGFFGR